MLHSFVYQKEVYLVKDNLEILRREGGKGISAVNDGRPAKYCPFRNVLAYHFMELHEDMKYDCLTLASLIVLILKSVIAHGCSSSVYFSQFCYTCRTKS
jgi:hypothetical protein